MVVEGGAVAGLQGAGLIVEGTDGDEVVVVTELGGVDSLTKDADGFVVDAEGNGKRVTVLAAVREGEARGIGEAAGSAVDDLRDHGQRFDGAPADARDEQELFEVRGAPFGCRTEARVEASQDDVGALD